MLSSSAGAAIRLRGVRQNNLKNLDLDVPLHQLVVITGLSGSGKSSLAFDTLFAEGQRRYIETFSPYARQFLDRMDKPRVDSIEGIPPAIAIEQRNSVKTTRSTVGTMTEICEYVKVLWSRLARLHCRQCGAVVGREPASRIAEAFPGFGSGAPPGGAAEVLITFDLELSARMSLAESLALVARQGYQRLLVGGRVLRLEEAEKEWAGAAPGAGRLTVVQDRVSVAPASRARFGEACEQAYHFGKGKLEIHELAPGGTLWGAPRRFSQRLHCATCDLEYRDPSPALFSFNHPVGACPKCKGFGRTITIDYERAIPDRRRTIAEGVVKPWLTGTGAESQADLLRFCRKRGVPLDVPFADLPVKWQEMVVEGDPGYGSDAAHQWPKAWYGVKGYFRYLESKAYKMHVRVLLSRYRAYIPCPDCGGKRFQPEALLYRVGSDPAAGVAGMSLADFYELPVRAALGMIDSLGSQAIPPGDPARLALDEVRARLGYLEEVGLSYLTLDRPTRSLSGGETERVNLTTCLGTRLVNTLFVLDEPSVGLHPRDTEKLIRILRRLRDAGNTVVVVEHEASVMRAADQIIDLGPGHGAGGGRLVFQGPWAGLLKAPESVTGQFLSRARVFETPPRRPVGDVPLAGRGKGRDVAAAVADGVLHDAPASLRAIGPVLKWLRLSGATRHNLQDLAVDIPLGRLVCVTGVSGSGKTTLVRDVLLPQLEARLRVEAAVAIAGASDEETTGAEGGAGEDGIEAGDVVGARAALEGAEELQGVVLVDQTTLGKTPRSNPAVYVGAFEDIRDFFAQTDMARKRGLGASAFSFNSAQGQCDRCRGAGYEKIEMQFLSDVFVRCPECEGRRYRPHILEVKAVPPAGGSPAEGVSIADLLKLTVEEARAFLQLFPESRPARRAVDALGWLVEVGLGYLELGQPVNVLSGGESQRLKLVRHLAAVKGAPAAGNPRFRPDPDERLKPLLFLFDEPTTGLHFEDVRVLLAVFHRLVEAGQSVVVIEHNLDVIRSADWVIDLGPEAGAEGGKLVAAGTPEDITACPASHTGAALRASADHARAARPAPAGRPKRAR